MRGSIKWQVNTLFNTIKQIGSSRHEAKQSAKAITQSNNPHDLAKQTGIYSYATLDKYREVAQDLLQYAKETYNVKDIEKISGQIVQSYLQNKLEQNTSYNTIQTYVAAITKLETALERYNGNTYDLSEKAHSVLEQARKDGLKEPEQHRAFEKPLEVINHIKNEDYKTIANFQLASGLRISELNHIRPDQLFTKDNKNFVSVEAGKGGKDRVVEVRDAQAFQAFKQLVESKQQPADSKYAGKFVFSKSSYTHAVTAAARAVGEHASGTHAFRWTYAQSELLHKITVENKSELQAKQELSEALGHVRIKISDHYLQ